MLFLEAGWSFRKVQEVDIFSVAVLLCTIVTFWPLIFTGKSLSPFE